MAKKIKIQVFDDAIGCVEWKEIAASVTDSDEIVFEETAICQKSATKTWTKKVDDNGVLATEEVV